MLRTQTLLLTMLLVLAGCSKIRKVTDEITKPSAREVYKRNFKKNDPEYLRWQQAYSNALRDSLVVPLPYGETGTFTPAGFNVYSYTVTLAEGEKLTVAIERDSAEVFIDIYDLNKSSPANVLTNDPEQFKVEYGVEATGKYKVIVQPEILASGRFTLLVNKEPVFKFPVAGKGNAAIQSFWGYERDGGRRSHEGVDIFAARGTPVVAVADGIVSNTGNRGLGGKQVWLRIGSLGYSLYYAHLDSIAVSSGYRTKEGDTLGFVGSTGNAAGGKPHLHFGIYKGYSGAVDPLPFIYQTPSLSAAKLERQFESMQATVTGAKANLRLGPGTSYATIATATTGDKLSVLGQSNHWLHITTTAGVRAYIHKSLVRQP